MNKIFKLTMLSVVCLMLLTGCKNQSGSMDSALPDVTDTEQSGVDEQETNIENDAQTETESANSTPKRKGPKYKADDAHKFFYGIWELTKVVSQHSGLGGDEGYEDVIGTQVAYSPDIYLCNGTVIRYPTYLMNIFPQDPDRYNPFLGDQRQTNLEDLLPGARYFIWIQIVNKGGVASVADGELLGNEFFLKDENTMYAFDYNCIYEMKRIGGVEDINTDNIPKDKGMPQERVHTQRDAYKMFYGGWKYKKIVWEQEGQQGTPEPEDLLGTLVLYIGGGYGWTQTDDDNIDSQTDDNIDIQMVDDIITGNAGYKIYLFSENEDDYSSFLESDLQIDMKELVPDEPYYICVNVCSTVKDEKDRGKKLILKNDNTMYAIENNCIYELERIEHIWNYDPEETITYHERY